ncbi:MAG: hypothetical protein BWK73_37545 [Thiothrix lacustris]|uniref:DUF898 domain-containing protein n=1 Tax=Thiothrix lacustris TaxID=525917 RepID=A0A1Y1QEW7_9GAMM|nr:MAG: hypothetical protein BWK73_37545 [Thiothrix lacustris]
MDTQNRELAFSFTGNGLEYFKIWIVNVLLTIVTLGIYSAWATVRTKRYFYGNTWLDGANFEYHATPKQILFGRLIAVVALGIYLLLSNVNPLAGVVLLGVLYLFMPWVVWRGLQFNARMSSYRNVRFSFEGRLLDAYKVLLFIPAVAFLIPTMLAGGGGIGAILKEGADPFELASTLMLASGSGFLIVYLLFPYLQQAFTHYYLNDSRYGQGRFSAGLATMDYYKIYLKWTLLGMAVFAVAGVLVVLLGGGISSGIFLRGSSTDGSATALMLGGMVLLVYIPFAAVGLFLQAYLRTRLRNYAFNQVQLKAQVFPPLIPAALRSTMSAATLWETYLGNALLMLVTLGLAYPWVKVRLARYTAASTKVLAYEDFSGFVTQQQQNQSALGAELGDAFDLDMGAGIGA